LFGTFSNLSKRRILFVDRDLVSASVAIDALCFHVHDKGVFGIVGIMAHAM
jgi:hypothetical protein